MVVGIYGISSQSGRAYLADYIARGYEVIGYTRSSIHGVEIVDAINAHSGLYLERPDNTNKEVSRFIDLGHSCVTNDLDCLIARSDIIIVALPSIYHEEAVKSMCEKGIWRRRIPLVLSPSRSIASPYLWNIIGARYPIVCFSTCPYSCKTPRVDVAYIKRRKRTWMISLEGDFNLSQIEMVKELFPQGALSKTPALTSLNNIGAVFHCATYLLNFEEIQRSKKEQKIFSFYMDGIANRPEVGNILEEIDQVRLQIAHVLGIEVFGLKNEPREDIWRKLTNGLRALEAEHENELGVLRTIRKQFLEYLNNCVVSAQHWLDITYGVVRMEGESLSDAIRRTPTYQKNSVPQLRYMEEDIPTGLVPFEALAIMLGIECSVVSDMINRYDSLTGGNVREKGRNLKDFPKEYLEKYLIGSDI